MNFKNIHVGKLIREKVTENGIEMPCICTFFKCSENEIEEMYELEDLNTEILLRWSKLLRYDFFRLYSQHLILYAPSLPVDNTKPKKPLLPKFKNSLYTKEIIDFILEQIESNKMTKDEVMTKYRIPKTTLYRWISKYKI